MKSYYALIPNAVRELSRDVLIASLESTLPDWDDPDISRARILSYCRASLVERFPCHDCGAPAGRECKPEYGCNHRSRY